MTDYRSSRDPLYRDRNDPATRNTGYEPAASDRMRARWGWIAGAVFLVVILGIAFGVGHDHNHVASNDAAPPAATHMPPPAAAVNPAPGLARPPAPAPAPAPSRP